MLGRATGKGPNLDETCSSTEVHFKVYIAYRARLLPFHVDTSLDTLLLLILSKAKLTLSSYCLAPVDTAMLYFSIPACFMMQEESCWSVGLVIFPTMLIKATVVCRVYVTLLLDRRTAVID